MPSSKGTRLVRENAPEHKWHSRLSRIVKVCCASNDANQCPGRYMGGKKGGKEKLGFPTRYLLLNSLNSGRGTEGTHMFCFLPFGFCQQKTPRDITFLLRSIRKPANSSKTPPPLTVCIGLVSVGVSATWVHFHLIPVNAGHVVNIPFSPVCEPSHPVQLGWKCSPTTFVA